MSIKVVIVIVVLLLSLYAAYLKNKIVSEEFNSFKFIEKLCLRLEENLSSNIYSMKVVFSKTASEFFGEIKDFSSDEQIYEFIRNLKFEANFFEKIITVLKEFSHAASTEIPAILENFKNLCREEDEILKEKMKKNGKILYILYPFATMLLSIIAL